MVFMASFEGLDDVLDAQHLDGLELAAVEAAEDPPVHRVALALLGVDGVEVGLHALHRLELVDEGLCLLRHPHQQVGLLRHLG